MGKISFVMNYILIVSSFGLLLMSWLALKMISSFRRVSETRAGILNIKSRLSQIRNRLFDDSRYLRSSQLKEITDDLLRLQNDLVLMKNLFVRAESAELSREISAVLKNLGTIQSEANEIYFSKEKARASEIFFAADGRDLLTDEQVRAVLSDDDRSLIVAGAGSGKTRVIDFKIRYLVNYKGVHPSKILVVSFSRKSAGDLVTKISQNVLGAEARTIHSFASQVSGRTDRQLFDGEKKELEALVIKALVRALSESAVFRAFEDFYRGFFSSIKPLIYYQTLDELRADLKKCNSKLLHFPDLFGEIKALRALKTLRGEFVRSVDERYIADFLYLQGIRYDYEPKYPHSRELYFPDFYLPDYQIYFEHFAITKSGRPPPYFDEPDKYMASIEWKRELHRENGTRMIESYSYLLNSGDTARYLGQVLKNAGVKVGDHLQSEEGYQKISREFCSLFSKFYRTFRLSGLSIDALKCQYQERGYSLFLQIFERFLSHFEELALQEGKMGFDDMLVGATSKYRQGGQHTYEYIIVDEFQDTSNLAMKLLDEVYQSSPGTRLLAVGDDWQSIYGFTGSDMTILTQFESRYQGSAVRMLNSNFRSHSRIVEIGKRFITKNPVQIRKEVVSRNSHFGDSEIDFLSFDAMEKKIASIPDDESVLVLYRYNDDCPAALGLFKSYFVMNRFGKPVRKQACKKNISLMTIHSAKGLEARHVFVLFPDGVRRKFPAEIEDHFVFDMLKANTDGFPFSEERRLMYVAITRAEQNLYFVSQNRDPNSVFWDELKTLVQSSNTGS